MPAKKLSITLDGSVWAEVASRLQQNEQNVSGTISRDLDRYYAALERARRSLREKLSQSEISAVIDNLNDCWMAEPYSIQLVYANIADGIQEEGLAQAWGIDGPALVEKLRTMSFIELCALVDASERWWNRIANGEKPDFSDAL